MAKWQFLLIAHLPSKVYSTTHPPLPLPPFPVHQSPLFCCSKGARLPPMEAHVTSPIWKWLGLPVHHHDQGQYHYPPRWTTLQWVDGEGGWISECTLLGGGGLSRAAVALPWLGKCSCFVKSFITVNRCFCIRKKCCFFLVPNKIEYLIKINLVNIINS